MMCVHDYYSGWGRKMSEDKADRVPHSSAEYGQCGEIGGSQIHFHFLHVFGFPVSTRRPI